MSFTSQRITIDEIKAFYAGYRAALHNVAVYSNAIRVVGPDQTPLSDLLNESLAEEAGAISDLEVRQGCRSRRLSANAPNAKRERGCKSCDF